MMIQSRPIAIIIVLWLIQKVGASSFGNCQTNTAEFFEKNSESHTLAEAQRLSHLCRRDEGFPLLAQSGLNISLEDPIPPTKKNKIIIQSIADFVLPRVLKKLLDVSNYFITTDKESLVYYDKGMKDWVLHTFDGTSTQMIPSPGMGIPLARCLSTAHGGNGYVTTQLDISVYAETTASAPVELMLPETQVDVLATFSSGLSIGGAASFTGSVTCNAVQGQYTQPYLYPYFFEIPRGRRIRTRYIQNKGLETYGEWKETPPIQRLVATALLECAVGNDTSICDHSVPRFWKDSSRYEG